MKSLIVYSSQSGNTHTLAQAVYDNIKGEKEICPVDQAPSSLDGYDLVAVGFWLQAGKPDPKTLAFLTDCEARARFFLFATHGAAKGSDHALQAMNHAIDALGDAQVAGTFSCQGQVNDKVLAKIKQKTPPPVWINDADTAAGHPDADDVAQLVAMVNAL